MSKYLPIAILSTLFIASCGTMQAVKETASNATEKVKYFSLSDLRPAGVDVVEVREKDLKEMPFGKERALAFDQRRKRSFWSFALPNFKEPTLPEVSDDEMDGSLLPPKPL